MALVTIITGRRSGKQTTLTPEKAEAFIKAMGKTKFNQRFTSVTKEVTSPTDRTLKPKDKKDETETIL